MEGATRYDWTLSGADGPVLSGSQAETTLTLSADDLPAGSYALSVQAYGDGEVLQAEDTLDFSLSETTDPGEPTPEAPQTTEKPGGPDKPGGTERPGGGQRPGGEQEGDTPGAPGGGRGGRSGGGRPGGGRSGGGSAGGTAREGGAANGTGESQAPEGFSGYGGSGKAGSGGSNSGAKGGADGQEGGEEASPKGFSVTPGEALIDVHISGTKDMTPHGAVALVPESGAMDQLTLGGEALDVRLSGGGSFTAAVEGATLTLTAEAGASPWRLNLLAVEILRLSGVETLKLEDDAGSMTLSTDVSLSGPIYAAYRSRGYVSKDMALLAGSAGCSVEIDDKTYGIGGDGSLLPDESDENA